MTLEENALVLCGIVASMIVHAACCWWRKFAFLRLLRQKDFEEWRDCTFGIREDKP